MIVYVESENKHYKCCPHTTEENTFIWEEFNNSGGVQSDWDQTDETKPDYIKNKPTLAPVATSGKFDDLVFDWQNTTLIFDGGDAGSHEPIAKVGETKLI
jgi:hypothetical protein